VHLLPAQIQTAQKKIDGLTVFLALLGSARVKARHKMLVKSTLDDISLGYFVVSRIASSKNIFFVLS